MKLEAAIDGNQTTPEMEACANVIAGDVPTPVWLAPFLLHFRGLIADKTSAMDRANFKDVITELDGAADLLLKWLPLFQHLPAGIQCPSDFSVVLSALPRIKKELSLLSGSSRRNMSQEFCAAVVIEAWKHLHGKGQVRSEKLYEACQAYWRACGGQARGRIDDPQNWQRTVEAASEYENPLITNVLAALIQNSP